MAEDIKIWGNGRPPPPPGSATLDIERAKIVINVDLMYQWFPKLVLQTVDFLKSTDKKMRNRLKQ